MKIVFEYEGTNRNTETWIIEAESFDEVKQLFKIAVEQNHQHCIDVREYIDGLKTHLETFKDNQVLGEFKRKLEEKYPGWSPYCMKIRNTYIPEADQSEHYLDYIKFYTLEEWIYKNTIA